LVCRRWRSVSHFGSRAPLLAKEARLTEYLTSRKDRWTDWLPQRTQDTINQSPLINTLMRMYNSQPADLRLPAMRDGPGNTSIDRIAEGRSTLAKEYPQPWHPAAEQAVNTTGFLANFIGPGARLPTPPKPQPQGIKAYHGSPHDFNAERLVRFPDGRTDYVVGLPDRLPDIPKGAELVRDYPLGRFREDKIGTGEGAQAYGRGAAYLAEAEAVAKQYRDDLGGFRWGAKIPSRVVDGIDVAFDVQQALQQANGSPARARQILEQNKRQFAGTGRDAMDDGALKLFDEIAPTLNPKASGRMYEVKINADPETFLDWDKPLAQQSDAVRSAMPSAAPEMTGELAYRRMAERQRTGQKTGDPLNDVLFDIPITDHKAASQSLRDAGIPGIRYKDAGSRGTDAGTYNYVVFDDKLIEILRKYGLLPPVAAGAASLAQQQEPPL